MCRSFSGARLFSLKAVSQSVFALLSFQSYEVLCCEGVITLHLHHQREMAAESSSCWLDPTLFPAQMAICLMTLDLTAHCLLALLEPGCSSLVSSSASESTMAWTFFDIMTVQPSNHSPIYLCPTVNLNALQCLFWVHNSEYAIIHEALLVHSFWRKSSNCIYEWVESLIFFVKLFWWFYSWQHNGNNIWDFNYMFYLLENVELFSDNIQFFPP